MTQALINTISERARAKINLTLHVGARRSDGYHPLESIVMFADIGDVLTAQKSDALSLTIDGPFGTGLSTGSENLIMQAVKISGLPPAAFHLTKNLPIASGIGGGSADAAAALRTLQALYHPIDDLQGKALKLGADVPVCLKSQSALMSGTGETLKDLGEQPSFAAVLINPGVSVSTGGVFNALDASSREDVMLAHEIGGSLLDIVRAGRNDLQDVACTIEPVIAQVLASLKQSRGVQIARMSGSGATCFAIFQTQEQSKASASLIKTQNPNWWCQAVTLNAVA